eukprot:COSAG03_NODE_2936_length_2344_cov_1.594209_3_plen_160_part_00
MRPSRLRSFPPTHTMVCDAVISGTVSPTGVNSNRKVAECFATGPGVQRTCSAVMRPMRSIALSRRAEVVWIDMARVNACGDTSRRGRLRAQGLRGRPPWVQLCRRLASARTPEMFVRPSCIARLGSSSLCASHHRHLIHHARASQRAQARSSPRRTSRT